MEEPVESTLRVHFSAMPSVKKAVEPMNRTSIPQPCTLELVRHWAASYDIKDAGNSIEIDGNGIGNGGNATKTGGDTTGNDEDSIRNGGNAI